jgi:hypothetical protein
LLKGTTVGLYAGKAAHLDDDGGNALQLVLAGLELAATLKHISIDETELDLTFGHIGVLREALTMAPAL